MKAALVNSLWLAASLPGMHRFRQAAASPEETQRRILERYLRQNRETEFGRAHHFAGIAGIAEFQRRVPLSTYDDYVPLIHRIENGAKNVLTAEPVQMFELSSGSTSASKMIPYPAALRSEFQRGLSPWIANLFLRHPGLMKGPAYWSISPLAEGRRRTPAGIPIGFEEDSAYLGPLGALIESALAVPDLVKHVRDVTAFRYVTLLFLLRRADLRLISVWNPTFLTLLLAPLSEWWEPLINDIDQGTLTPPSPIDPGLRRGLERKLSPQPRRARALRTVGHQDHASIWPHLELLSCWADGASAPYARALGAQFPGVMLQPKGLLSTEAFVSFPLIGCEAGVAAVTSHFLEFLTESGDALLAHQLQKGSEYAVVVTTGGGFYRYQLQDRVEVAGFYGRVPCLRFTGKTDQVSDHFGEKLNGRFVAGVLADLFARHRVSPGFAMLAPDNGASVFHYTLYLECPSIPPGLPFDLEAALCANFHYDYCRKLGQLAPAQVALVCDGAAGYLRACQARGQRLGDIKPVALHNAPGWDKWLSLTDSSFALEESRPEEP
jgi:GH3 auxin-responsive promoter